MYPEATPASGGANPFLAFIEHELFPLVEKEYRVDTSNRGLLGSSYGGLFAAWTMVNRPELFQRFIMASPALYWDDYLFFKKEEELWHKSKTLNAKVYVSAGEKELEPFMQSVIRFRERFIAHSSGPHHQDSGEAKIRESTAGVSRKPSSDCKACGCSSKHLCGLTAWNT